jgi:hypothetical protein
MLIITVIDPTKTKQSSSGDSIADEVVFNVEGVEDDRTDTDRVVR